MSLTTSELRVRLACRETGLSPPVKYFYCPFQGGASFVDHLCYLNIAFASVHFCLVVTCWKRADLLALVCDVYLDFVNFPFGILGQMWYLIVSIPDPYCLSYIQSLELGIFPENFHVCACNQGSLTVWALYAYFFDSQNAAFELLVWCM